MEVDTLPLWAIHCLASTLAHKAYDDLLSVTWYEYQTRSNFDKFDREKIRDAAEEDGLVVYARGGPRVTEKGIEWAQEERLALNAPGKGRSSK